MMENAEMHLWNMVFVSGNDIPYINFPYVAKAHKGSE